jgi:anti-sigma factor RsiW
MTTQHHDSDKPYLTCQQVLDFVMGYLDHELDTDTCTEFERHLKVCPSCVNYLAGYKKTVELGKAALCTHEDPSRNGIPDGLVNAILAARAKDVQNSSRS